MHSGLLPTLAGSKNRCAFAETEALSPTDDGTAYRIQPVGLDGRFPELRWTRSVPPGRLEIVNLRDLVAQLQDYEPARSLTANAVVVHRSDPTLSTARLTAELTRLAESPKVLNRRLREAVQSRLARGELTMSEIAIRCGRVKRDRRGNISGETSWLARRIGQLPEAGRTTRLHGCTATPWRSSRATAFA